MRRPRNAWHVQGLPSLGVNQGVVESLLLDLALLDALQRLGNLLGRRGRLWVPHTTTSSQVRENSFASRYWSGKCKHGR